MPARTAGMPHRRELRMLKPGRPFSVSRPLVMMLVVVNRVAMPPRMVPKTGMNEHPRRVDAWRRPPDTAGSSTPRGGDVVHERRQKGPGSHDRDDQPPL